MNKMLEICIHARAGQGSKTMAQFIAEAAAEKGYYVQAFPYYGPARSGAPMDAFVRISQKPIQVHSPVINPDILVVLDEALIALENICLPLTKDQILIINTKKNIEEVEKAYKTHTRTYVVNGSGIALKHFKKDFANTVLLGTLSKITKQIELKDFNKIVKNKFFRKYGQEMVDLNIKAIKEGFDAVK